VEYFKHFTKENRKSADLEKDRTITHKEALAEQERMFYTGFNNVRVKQLKDIMLSTGITVAYSVIVDIELSKSEERKKIMALGYLSKS